MVLVNIAPDHGYWWGAGHTPSTLRCFARSHLPRGLWPSFLSPYFIGSSDATAWTHKTLKTVQLFHRCWLTDASGRDCCRWSRTFIQWTVLKMILVLNHCQHSSQSCCRPKLSKYVTDSSVILCPTVTTAESDNTNDWRTCFCYGCPLARISLPTSLQ